MHTAHSAHCTLPVLHITHDAPCKLHNVHLENWTLHTLHIAHCALCILCTPHIAAHFASCTQRTLHTTQCTRTPRNVQNEHRSWCRPRYANCTLQTAQCALCSVAKCALCALHVASSVNCLLRSLEQNRFKTSAFQKVCCPILENGEFNPFWGLFSIELRGISMARLLATKKGQKAPKKFVQASQTALDHLR